MLRFIALRILRIVPIVAGVVTIIFLIFQLVPGDPAVLMAGPMATEEQIATLRHAIGLDQPIYLQYWHHLIGLFTGNFGYSLTYKGSPLGEILARLPATLTLAATAIALTICLGIPAGILAALNRDHAADYAISFSVVALLAMPNFWLGLVLISVFSVDLGWLPSFGFDGWRSVIMPALALAARLIALVARLTRGVMIEELRKDYVRTARAKGLPFRTVVLRHVLRNVLIPTITVIGLQMGYLLGGSIVIERLFAWPGIGDLLINAVGLRDYNLIQAITVLFTVGFLLVNLVVDILYMAVNPRLRHA
jgi:ABC-type dipeptide/oligopeptide/nickel transport system permease component